jgi:hypothetical protein
MIAALPERRLGTQKGLRGFPQSPHARVNFYASVIMALFTKGMRTWFLLNKYQVIVSIIQCRFQCFLIRAQR